MSRLTLILCLAASLPLGAQSLHVDADAVPGGDGSSWDQALVDLQQALDIMWNSPGQYDTVWMAEGTYVPPGADPGARYVVQADVTIYAGFTGGETHLEQRDPLAHPVILSGDRNGDDGPDFSNYADNCHNVIWVINDAYFALDGATVRGGNAWGSSSLQERGGGLHSASRSNQIIRNCVFRENRGRFGAGLYCDPVVSSGVPFFEFLIEDCRFLDNEGESVGGLEVVVSNQNLVTLRRCHVEGNRGTYWGGGAKLEGSGIELGVRVEDCTFVDNVAPGFGGLRVYGNVEITGCEFRDNHAEQGAGFDAQGGALQIGEGGGNQFVVRRNVFCDNTSTAFGGAIRVNADAPVLIENCSFWNHSAPVGGTIYSDFGSDDVLVQNCIVAGTTVPAIDWEFQSTTVLYSLVEGGMPGEGNFDADPLFTDPGSCDLTLQVGSPCIDAGNPTTLDEDGSIADVGALPLLATFVRGDANVDGGVDVADAVFTLTVLFLPAAPDSPCEDSMDSNDDGDLNIADVIYTLDVLFSPDGAPPVQPWPDCGSDSTIDDLGCESPCAA